MVILFCVILWIVGDILIDCGSDWSTSERNAERRHQELMRTKQKKTRTVRREVHDRDGRYAVEEITEEE